MSDTNTSYSVQYGNNSSINTNTGNDGRNNGADVRLKMKSEKGSSPNTYGDMSGTTSATLSNQSSGGSQDTNGISEKEHHLGLKYREEKEEKRNSESDDRSPVHCSSQIKEHQKQQLMTQQHQREQQQHEQQQHLQRQQGVDMMDINEQQQRAHSAMTLDATLGSNGSISSFQQHHYPRSESADMVGHVNNDNNNGGPGGNLPALKGVASMSSANYLRKSVSCQRIDEILKDSMDAFHRDGPLVSPLRKMKPGGSERHKNRHAFGGETAFSGGSWMVDSPMRDRMSYVCESKGFDYGIFWKLDRQRTSLMPAESNISPRFAADTNRLSLFVSTSKTLFTRYVLGFGMPGRVCHSGNYEWHEDISLLPGWSFQRKVQAERAGLKTIICVPVEDGVVEFGLTDEMDHSVAIVQYVQKMCKSLPSSR
tara:strand:+ start:4466 stop:5737 length:1272 start_codon:yes stop_codon:yes gene_type:complete